MRQRFTYEEGILKGKGMGSLCCPHPQGTEKGAILEKLYWSTSLGLSLPPQEQNQKEIDLICLPNEW